MLRSKKDKKIIVILGPTASGKTKLGIDLAKKFNGEIISADSRQVYKGLDLGTAKVENIKPKFQSKFQKKMGYCIAEGVPHWLIDVADLREEVFTAANFKKMAELVIEDIFRRNKVPFIVGGSMLYIDALVEGFRFAPKVDSKIREKLKKKTLKKLQQFLREKDPRAYKKIDLNNPQRLIRALEVKLATGKSIVDFWKKNKKYKVLKIGIEIPRDELYKKIDSRVDERLRKGMLKEVKSLIKKGFSKEKLISLGLEYRCLTLYLEGKFLSLNEAVDKLKKVIHHFARRQLIWWRRDKEILWVKDKKEAEKAIQDFIKN